MMERTRRVHFTLNDLVELLDLCKAFGYIELKVSLAEIKEIFQVAWGKYVVGENEVKSPDIDPPSLSKDSPHIISDKHSLDGSLYLSSLDYVYSCSRHKSSSVPLPVQCSINHTSHYTPDHPLEGTTYPHESMLSSSVERTHCTLQTDINQSTPLVDHITNIKAAKLSSLFSDKANLSPLPPCEANLSPVPPHEAVLSSLSPREANLSPLPPHEADLSSLPPHETDLSPLPPREADLSPLPPCEADLSLVPADLSPVPPHEAVLSSLSPFEADLPSREANLSPHEVDLSPVPPHEADLSPLPHETDLSPLPPQEADVSPLQPPCEADLSPVPPREADLSPVPPHEAVLSSLSPFEADLPPREANLSPLSPHESDLSPVPPHEVDLSPLPHETDLSPLPPREADVSPLQPPREADLSPVPPHEAVLSSLSPSEADLPPHEANLSPLSPHEADLSLLPPREADLSQLPPREADLSPLPPREADLSPHHNDYSIALPPYDHTNNKSESCLVESSPDHAKNSKCYLSSSDLNSMSIDAKLYRSPPDQTYNSKPELSLFKPPLDCTHNPQIIELDLPLVRASPNYSIISSNELYASPPDHTHDSTNVGSELSLALSPPSHTHNSSIEVRSFKVGRDMSICANSTPLNSNGGGDMPILPNSTPLHFKVEGDMSICANSTPLNSNGGGDMPILPNIMPLNSNGGGGLESSHSPLFNHTHSAGGTNLDNSHPPLNHTYISSFGYDFSYIDINTPDLVGSPVAALNFSDTPTHCESSKPAIRANVRTSFSDISHQMEGSSCQLSPLSERNDFIGSSIVENINPDLVAALSFSDTPTHCESSKPAIRANVRTSFSDISHQMESSCQPPPLSERNDFIGASIVENINPSTSTEDNISRDRESEESSSSEDEDNDEKLELLFSQMKVQRKQHLTKIVSRKSISEFIVSDSEDLGTDHQDEEVKENISPISPPYPPPIYHTPCTPNTGVIFWGSPTLSRTSRQRPCTARKPPPLTPMNRPLPVQPLTTPSAMKNFSRFKKDMIKENFKLFNESVFEEKLPLDTEIVWNNKLRSTAGYCFYKGIESSRTARIELSTKVVDSYDRIQSTLVHEMCHAATWIINGIKREGHGPVWKAWAEKVRTVYPGIKPVTCYHSYNIQYKHKYRCVSCDFRLGRHSKSVNLNTARCPMCCSHLEYIPRLRADGTPMMERKLNKYAQYVKDHYNEVKTSSPWRSHKEVMERVKELYHSC